MMQPGELLGRLRSALGETYDLERELGGAGMSRIFLGADRALGRQVVVKVLAPELTSEALTARFKREFEVTAQLQHPHILPILATGTADGVLYYVMPYVEGESLRHRLTRGGRFSLGDAHRILYEVSDALAYAHERGVVHRDIKPENILLQGEHAVLADFGIARVLSSERTNGTRLTEIGTSIGTLGYMAPEQAAGDVDVDARADVYALGIVGYELLTGAPPFTETSPSAILRAHLTEVPRPVTELRAEIPPSFSAAISRALEKAPEARFPSAVGFRDALGITFGSGTIASAASASGRRSTLLMRAIVGAALLAAAVWGMRAFRTPSSFDAHLLAVAPFDVLGDGIDVWREGMVDLLASNLAGAGELRTVSPTVAIRKWKGRADEESARELSRRTGARLTLFGRLIRSGPDTVRLAATLYDAARARSLATIEMRGPEARMDRLADSLSLQVLAVLGRELAIAPGRRGSIGSSSLAAVKAYLHGEQFYRKVAWDSAARYFAEAIALDTNFAPALRRMSNVLEWKVVPGYSDTSHIGFALRAGRANHGLAARESLLVAADSQWRAIWGVGTTRDRAEMVHRVMATLATATRQFPDEPEAWFKLGDARFHFWPEVASESFATSWTALRRAAALDSAFGPTVMHMLDVAIISQETDSARRYLERFLDLSPPAEDVRFAGALAVLLDPARTTRVDVDSLVATLAPDEARQLLLRLRVLMDSSQSYVRVLGAMAKTPTRWSDDGRSTERALRANLAMGLATRGRIAEAQATADPMAPDLFAELALLGVVSDSALAATRAAWDTDPVPARAMLLWGIWAERGDTAAFARSAATMSALERPRDPEYLTPYVIALDAHRALARGDTAGALSRFASIPDSICLTQFCDLFRLTHARALRSVGRHAQAASVLARHYSKDAPSRVLWVAERARAAEQMNDRTLAANSYSFLTTAWANADASIAPLLTEAREALARLRGGRPRSTQ